MTRDIDLDVHLNRLAGGVARVWSGVVANNVDDGDDLQEVIQVTSGKKLVIYMINVHFRNVGVASGGITLVLDERDDEPGASVAGASTVICDRMFTANASRWVLMNLRGCPIIGGVDKSLYALGEDSSSQNRPPTFVWYDEI